MLGFSSISETSITELPGSFIPLETGVSATLNGADGNTTQAIAVNSVFVTGTSIVATVELGGNLFFWDQIVPDVGNTYANLTTGASQTYTNLATGASQTFSQINTGTSQTWTDENTGASQTWTDIPQ